MDTNRLNELRTFDTVTSTPQQTGDAILELTAEVQRCWARMTELEKDADFLTALRNAGVDNWEGYSLACQGLRGDEDDDE